MIDSASEDLAGKTVLEVGSGRGDSTRKLVRLLAQHPGATLIATDLSDAHFATLRHEFAGAPVRVEFRQASAHELNGIADGSIDCIVCNYTLCAVNAQAGLATLALRRFWKVLRPGGRLFIEEEFPTSQAGTATQEVWAQKWRLLKAATILAGGFPFSEFAPDTLAQMCRIVGFDVSWQADAEFIGGANVLDFFQRRLDRLLAALPDDTLRAGFARLAAELHEQARQAGGMEIPFYRLSARKLDAP